MRNQEVVERFLREAKVAARVNSEHVARVSDVGKVEPDGVPFIVMEYLEGSDLGATIGAAGHAPARRGVRNRPSSVRGARRSARRRDRPPRPQASEPLRHAPRRRVALREAARLRHLQVHVAPGDEGVDPALTATATIMGSPSYMSPEQLKSTKEVDARTDVWALGAVLYEAVTGRPAFRGETVPQVCFLIGSEESGAAIEPAPGGAARVERAILACLDKKAETRATLVDLARALVGLAPDRARGCRSSASRRHSGKREALRPKEGRVAAGRAGPATHEAARTQRVVARGRAASEEKAGRGRAGARSSRARGGRSLRGRRVHGPD